MSLFYNLLKSFATLLSQRNYIFDTWTPLQRSAERISPKRIRYLSFTRGDIWKVVRSSLRWRRIVLLWAGLKLLFASVHYSDRSLVRFGSSYVEPDETQSTRAVLSLGLSENYSEIYVEIFRNFFFILNYYNFYYKHMYHVN